MTMVMGWWNLNFPDFFRGAMVFRVAEPDAENDQLFMRKALAQAKQAFDEGEVPIGAIVVSGGKIIGTGRNSTELLQDPTAHAEMLALTSACSHLGSKYLPEATLYVTIEPCPMCAAAMNWAQIARVVFGANEIKRGFSLFTPNLLHPKTQLSSGVLPDDCAGLMQAFFQARR